MTLRMGLVGTGFMAGVHAGALAKIGDAEVVAVCGRTRDRAAAFIARQGLGAAHPYGDVAAMLDAERLDALYLCIPPAAHAGEVELATARGLHLFLEKPITISAERAETMVTAIERAGVKSQVGFHLRFRRSVRRLRQMLADGTAGRPTLFSGRYWTNMDGSLWWRDRAQSGGQAFEQAIHLYDLALHLFGPAQAATGMADNLCHRHQADYTIEDTSIGMFRHGNGALGVVTASNCAVPMHFFGDFRAVCANAVLDYRSTGQAWVEPDRAVLQTGEKGREEWIEDDDPYLRENQDFIAAIREDRATLTPARDGLAAIRLVEMAMGETNPNS